MKRAYAYGHSKQGNMTRCDKLMRKKIHGWVHCREHACQHSQVGDGMDIAPPTEGGFRLPNASNRERCLSGPCMTERGQEEPGSWGTEPERAAAAYR